MGLIAKAIRMGAKVLDEIPEIKTLIGAGDRLRHIEDAGGGMLAVFKSGAKVPVAGRFERAVLGGRLVKMARPGLVGKVTEGAARGLGNALIEHPVSTVVGGGLVGADIAERAMVQPVIDAMVRSRAQEPTSIIDDYTKQRELDEAASTLDAERARRRRFLDQLEVQRPDIYYQIVAGRRLPPGTIVVGGDPNNPAMDEAARMVSQGRV